MKRKVLEKYIMQLPKNAKILDIGCSDCAMLKMVKSIRPDVECFGINITLKGYTVPTL